MTGAEFAPDISLVLTIGGIILVVLGTIWGVSFLCQDSVKSFVEDLNKLSD